MSTHFADRIGNAAKIQQDYTACLKSVTLVNNFVAGEHDAKVHPNPEDSCGINVLHLELMGNQTYWTTQSMTPIINAIAAGKNWLGW